MFASFKQQQATPPTMFVVNIDENIMCLRNAIEKVLSQDYTGISYQEVYRNTYALVLNRKANKIADIFSDAVETYLKGNIIPCIEQRIITNFMDAMHSTWTDYDLAVIISKEMLSYVEKNPSQNETPKSIYNIGLQLFSKLVINSIAIREALYRNISEMISKERNGAAINANSIRNIINILNALDLELGHDLIYENCFENQYLKDSANFYQNEAQILLSQSNIVTYLQKYKEKLHEEKMRAARYLLPKTSAKILNVVENVMFSDCLSQILAMENGLKHLVKIAVKDEISLTYNQIKKSKIPAEQRFFIKRIEEFFEGEMKAIVDCTNNTSPTNMVEDLTKIRDRYEEINRDCLNSDEELKKFIEKKFELSLNANPKIPQYLAEFFHTLLIKNDTENQKEVLMKKALTIFIQLSEKDIFEIHYREYMAKRLLRKTTTNEREKYIISQLKNECGMSYTHKLERMLTDIEIANTHLEVFDGYKQREELSLAGIDLQVTVITSGLWPYSVKEIVTLPPSSEFAFNAFKRCYINIHNGRKLDLLSQLGNAQIGCKFQKIEDASSKVNLNARSYIFDVTTRQMCILLLFNKKDKFTFEELKLESGISVENLKRELRSLTRPGHRILLSTNTTAEYKELDAFTINERFSSPHKRIKVKMATKKTDIDAEKEKLDQHIAKNREFEVDAALVRVMKSRQRITLQLLISEVTTLLQGRFKAQPKMIKARIEILIIKEYMKRDPDDQKVFTYIA